MIAKIFDSIRNIGFVSIFLILGYVLNPFNYGFYFTYLLIIWLIFKIDFIKINLDLNFLLLLFFGTIYGLFYSFNPVGGGQYIVIYAVTPPVLYLWGKYIAQNSKNTEHLFFLIIAIGFVFSINALISVLLDIRSGGFVQSSRNVPMFWGDTAMNATGMASLFVFNMCIPSILLSSFNKIRTPVKLLLCAIFVLSAFCVLRLGSRTQLVITLATFLGTMMYLLPKQTLKQNLVLFGILTIAMFFVFRNVSFNLDADWLSSFAGRMEKNGGQDIASGGGRTQRWIKSLEYLFEKPLGWDVNEFGYSHNLWLDVLRVGGFISFLLLVLFTIRSLIQVKKFVKVKPVEIYFNVLILVYFFALLFLFMVEPIIDGSFSIFILFCILMGIIAKYREIQTIKP